MRSDALFFMLTIKKEVINIHKKTINLIQECYKILEDYNPMTVRQVYYQLVSKQIIDNNLSNYKKVSNVIVQARQKDLIPWEWVEDRIRRPRDISMWRDLNDFMETVKQAYRRDVWGNQDNYVVVWLEKDALSGIFEDVIHDYGITLIVGRGYNSWSIRKEMADRFKSIGKPAYVLYFGDFDPSGEDICRDLNESFRFFGTSPKTIKVSLTKDDVIKYKLPPDPAKKTDTRSREFIKKNGDISVELDALPVQVLKNKIRESIECYMNIDNLEQVRNIQKTEQYKLEQVLNAL